MKTFILAATISVWVMAGQSNNQGRSPDLCACGGEANGNTNVLFYGGTMPSSNSWATLKPPTERVNVGSAYTDFYGSEIASGPIIAAATGNKIAIVKFSCWDTLDADWAASGACWVGLTNKVSSALSALHGIGYTGTVTGVFWMQGESDTLTSGAASRYGANLTNFIARCRTEWNPSLRFVLGRISPAAAWTYYADVTNGQHFATGTVSDVHLVITDDLPKITDGVHLNGGSQIELGRRWGAKAIQ